MHSLTFGRVCRIGLASAALATVALYAVGAHVAQAGGKKKEQQAKVSATAGKIGSDGKQTVTITMDINKDWYAYANPVKNEILEAAQTIVKITAGAKLQDVKIHYPPGKQKVLAEDKLQIYEGKVEITVFVQRSAGDNSPLLVEVQFNTCHKGGSCLPTDNVKLELK